MNAYTATLTLGGRQYQATRQGSPQFLATLGGGAGGGEPPFIWELSNATTATVPLSVHGKQNLADVVCQLSDGEFMLPDSLGFSPSTKEVFFQSSVPVTGRLIIS